MKPRLLQGAVENPIFYAAAGMGALRAVDSTTTGLQPAPRRRGADGSDEMLRVEEAIDTVDSDERAGRKECAAVSKTRDEDQVMRYGEVLDNQTWTVTSMPIDNAEQPAKTAIGA